MKAVWISIALAFPFICNAQIFQRGIDSDALRGRVKTMSVSRYTSLYVDEIRKFVFDSSSFWVHHFDSAGNKVMMYRIENGHPTSIVRFEYKFDVRGNKIEECGNEDGKLTVHRTFTYDTIGNLIRQNFYDKYYVGRSTKYIYADGKIVLKEDSIINGIVETTYQYDSKGKLTEEAECRRYTIDGHSPPIIYTYDSNGKKVSEKRHFESITIISKFDEHGNEIQEPDFMQVHIYTPQYIYDRHNNWIRHVVTESDVEHIAYDENEPPCSYPIYQLTVRQIEYY